MSLRIATLAFILVVALTGCGSTASRAQDAQPLSDQVPAQADATVPPVAPAAAAPAPALDATAVTFSINGGIVGFCDELVINANGDYQLTTCNQGQVSGTLPQSDRVSLKSWLENLSSFQLYTDDGAQAADGMSTDLSFVGQGSTAVEDPQKQMIFDWVSGLIVQLRPKPQLEPTPTVSVAAAPQGALCPDIQRPALVLVDFENPTGMELFDVSSQAACPVTLSQPPFGRIISGGGNLYYLVANSDTKSVTVWELNASGEQKPLDFTTMVMEEPSPHGFIVSDDGSKIAWAQTVVDLESDPAVYKNYLWQANIDGSERVTLLDGVDNTELRFAFPIRFSAADNSLYYALQPDIGGPVFSGRFDTLYHAPAGGQPELVYACPVEDNPVCITGLALDGSVLTTLDPATDSIQVLGRDGAVINSIPLPGTGYVEHAAFSPNGSLAFVSATLTEPASEEEMPLPNPGYLTVLAAPYTGQPQTLLADNTVGTLWGWVNDNLLVYGAINAEGLPTTATVDLNGQVKEVSAKFAVGVLSR